MQYQKDKIIGKYREIIIEEMEMDGFVIVK